MTVAAIAAGAPMWRPSEPFANASQLATFMTWLRRERGLDFSDYASLWDWSVTDIEAFWQTVVDYFDVRFDTPARAVLDRRTMPGARWGMVSGSSYAAAHVSGMLALIGELKPQLSGERLHDGIVRSSGPGASASKSR